MLNPFRNAVVGDPWEIPEADVGDIGRQAFDACCKAITTTLDEHRTTAVLIRGEPGSGKSALLRESGFELPAEFARLPAPGPTRDCDFWLANEAILLDTSGRYSRSEEAADRSEWRSLLRLVRGARPGMPVNGVVVAVPATSLLGRSASDVEENARQLRRTLNEIIDELGVDAPIYIAVTKVDLVDGFVELASAQIAA